MYATLESGVHVICDRYTASGAAFSYAKGVSSLDWCKSADVGLIQPDLTIYLDIDVADAAQRSGYGEERYETRQFQTTVKKIYDDMASTDPMWHTIVANKSQDQVAVDVFCTIEREVGPLK
jgi:dTMP kinase